MALEWLWLGQFLLSISWLYFPTIYTLPSPIWSIFVFSGLFFNIISLRNIAIHSLNKKYYVVLIPFVLGLIILPFPYCFSSVLLLFGAAFVLLKGYIRLFSCIGLGFMLTGAILSLQTLVVPVFFSLFSRYHQINFISGFLSFLLNILGLTAISSGGELFLLTYTKILSLQPTWEQFAIYPLLNILVSGAFLNFCFWLGWRQLVKFLLFCMGYAFLRYIFMVFLFLEVKNSAIFWQPLMLTLSFLPFVIILMKFCPIIRERRTMLLDMGSWHLGKKSLLPAALIFLCSLTITWAWCFQDPGFSKKGRVLIDEKHSNWEWTTQRFDTKIYGYKSVYNYYCFADFMNHYYTVSRNTSQRLTSDLLSEYDVLIVKVPTEAFEKKEIQAIEGFVKSGGGLFLIGDHTNVFGTSRNLNPLASQFGLQFKYDSISDLSSGRLSLYRPPKVSPHPIVRNIPAFLFATSCSLLADPHAEAVMVGSGLKGHSIDYSRPYFFPDANVDENYEFGIFLQAAAVKHGRGRVVAFTDSTCFSNYLMFLPGKPEFALGVIEWLNRTNRYAWMKVLFSIVALFGAVGAIGSYRRLARGEGIFLSFGAAFFGICLALWSIEHLQDFTYPLPKPHTKYCQINFESEYSDIDLPAYRSTQNYNKSYNTFYIWTQRLGYFPSLQPSLKLALQGADIVVIVNPKKSFTSLSVKRLTEFIEKGGALLLLEGPRNLASTTNQLLRHFGIEVDFTEVRRSMIYDGSQGMCFAYHPAAIKGGKPILTLADGHIIFSTSRIGKGILGVMSDSDLFTDAKIGTYQTSPNREQLKISKLEFWILKNLVREKSSQE